MRYRQLGRTGLIVSAVCLGTNTFGDQVDESQAVEIVGKAIDGGVNFIDTADLYAHTAQMSDKGKAEKFIGRAISGRRHEVVVATKVGGEMDSGVYGIGLSRKRIMQGVEQSLVRLETDYIDLYYAHIPDDFTPIEETLRAFDDLVQEGKVRYLGCSNFSAWQLARALWASDKHDLDRFECIESPYNLVTRDLEYEVVPLCRKEQVGICTYNSLAGGLLSGKHDLSKPPVPGTRFALEVVGPIHTELYWTEDNFNAIAYFKVIAEEIGCTMAQLAVAWLINNPNVTSAICGVTSINQLKQNIQAAEIDLGDDVLDRCDAIWRNSRRSGYRINTIRQSKTYLPKHRGGVADWDFCSFSET